MGCDVDIDDSDNQMLEGKPLEHAHALARAMWAAELDARVTMTVRSSAMAKIKRHDGVRAKADAPAMTEAEKAEIENDLAFLDSLFPTLGLASVPKRQRLQRWVALRDTGRGKRGTGARELNPGIGAAAFVFLNWRYANDLPITARLEASVSTTGEPPLGAVEWNGDAVRLYHPSATVRWLAAQLCELHPALGGADRNGRRADWHLAFAWTQKWREWRGMTKGSR